MNKKVLFFSLVVLLVLIDRILKITLVKSSCFFLFCIKPTINFGASFGLFSGLTWLLVIIGVLVLGIIGYFYIKYKDRLLQIALIFLFSGTLGNLIDRIFYGYVLDFIGFSFIPTFPAFNLADVLNLVGAIMLIIFLFRKK
ncbi:MAG: signal peptidase II [archaeon]